jgi:hypothetical protein
MPALMGRPDSLWQAERVQLDDVAGIPGSLGKSNRS